MTATQASLAGGRELRRSVLIVDGSAESREVLRTVLERRGTTIWEASSAREGLELARQHQPAVVVLDLETDAADDERVQMQYGRQARSQLVLLGTMPRSLQTLPRERALAKPYHYGPLIRTIEGLLGQSTGGHAGQPAAAAEFRGL